MIDLADKKCHRNKHNLLLKKDTNFKVDIHINYNNLYIVILFENQLKLINFDLNFKEINKIKVLLSQKFSLSKDNQLQADWKNNIIAFNDEQIENVNCIYQGENDIKYLILNHSSKLFV